MFNRKIIKFFENWKNRKDRKPLILRGARQVGKTVSVHLFGQKFFKDLIWINLEDPEQERLFRDDSLSLEDFEKIIQLKFGKFLKEGETLLFIDEIQNSIPLMKLLRFFYERRPLLHVIAAGSLLEVKLKKGGFSFPVGRVEYAYLYPLDFFEFLEARGKEEIVNYLKTVTQKSVIPSSIHEMALKHFYEYLMVGGMPEVVKTYKTEKNFSALNRIYNSLLTSYHEDIFKYSSEAKSKYLAHCLENIPLFAGQTVTYEHFAGSTFKSREISEAFEILEKVMLLYRAMGTKDFALPLIPKRKKPPKLIFLDVGLSNYCLGIRDKLIEVKELNEFFRGTVAEQVVGQHLLTLDEENPPKIYYWYRDSPGSTAEIDYILTLSGKIVPIKVKSGKTGRLRSLREFAKISGIKEAIRIYSGQLKKEKVKINDVEFNLISLPFYLLPHLKQII